MTNAIKTPNKNKNTTSKKSKWKRKEKTNEIRGTTELREKDLNGRRHLKAIR